MGSIGGVPSGTPSRLVGRVSTLRRGVEGWPLGVFGVAAVGVAPPVEADTGVRKESSVAWGVGVLVCWCGGAAVWQCGGVKVWWCVAVALW